MRSTALRLFLFVLALLLASFVGAAETAAKAATFAEALAEGQRRLAAEDGKGARGFFERALELARQAEDREGTAAALIGLGDTYHPQQESDKALEMYQQALAAAPQSAAARARVAYVSGIRAAGRDDLAAADEQFAITIAAARESGDHKLEAKALLARGNMALRRGDMPAAWDLYSTALPLAIETGSRSAVMLTERGLGDVEQARGHNAEALEHFEKSLSVARETHNSRIVEGVLNTMGTVYLEWADYGKALQYFQEALHTETDDPSEVAYTFNNLGYAYGSQGNSDLALSYFRKALPLMEKLGDNYGVMRVLNNLGELHAGAGDLGRALQDFTRAQRLARKAGDKAGEAGHWHNLGWVYESQKRYDLATAAYRKSQALDESLGERNHLSQALSGLARVHLARKQYAQAVEMADQAARVAGETGSQEISWQARTLAGRALHALHRDEAARGAYAEAIATVEQVRSRIAGGEISREAFFENHLEPYQRMVELLADRGEAAAALAQADRAKGRTLVEILRSGRVDLDSQLTPEERAAEARLRERLTALNGEVFVARSRTPADPAALTGLEQRLQQARLDLEAFSTNLYAARPALRTQRADFPVWSLEAARGLLAAGDTALIEYAVQDEKTFLFVVTADGGASPTVRLHRLPIGSRELARQVEAFRRQLGNRDLDFRAPARHLYNLLLGPAAAEIGAKRTLCIVPNGPLWDLPFQALQPSATEALLERHALYYAPSLSFLAELAARRAPRPVGADPVPPSLLAVGNPALRAGAVALADSRRGLTGLAPLPDAEREVRDLARLYGSGRSAVYTAAQASERMVKTEAGHFRVLHFATHALLDDHNPLYSSLVLSPAGPRDGEDGLLEVWEILGLHLDADLVVLSACQTARGRPRAGEGMIGMSWALAAAGSPATLASQWEVDSASTGQLMVEFHRGWLSGQSKAEALRRAALAVRRQPRYRHPFYWAGFVLVGRGD
jgi:CHAT domain-containing protein/tetratricopeptide (TPR) repeat protein